MCYGTESYQPFQLSENGLNIIFILEMKKPRLRDINMLKVPLLINSEHEIHQEVQIQNSCLFI